MKKEINKSLNNKIKRIFALLITTLLITITMYVGVKEYVKAYSVGEYVYAYNFSPAYGAWLVGIRVPASGDGAFYCIQKGNTKEASKYLISDYTGCANEFEKRKLQAIVGYGGTIDWTWAKQLALWMGHKGLSWGYASSGYSRPGLSVPSKAEVYKIIDSATEYAEKSTNAVEPSIEKDEKCTVINTTGNTYKIGPFKLKYDAQSIYNIDSIKVYADSGELNVSGYQDENGNSITEIPASDQKFYMVLTDIDLTKTQKINKITLTYSYTDYSDISIYEAVGVNPYTNKLDYSQRTILVEGQPKTGSKDVDLNPDLIFITGSYNLELSKIDSRDDSIKLQDVEFKVTQDNNVLGTYKTNANGVISISDIQINSEDTQKVIIEEVKGKEDYEALASKIELDVKIKIADEVINGVKTGKKKYEVSEINVISNSSNDDESKSTITLSKVENSNVCTIGLKIPNVRKTIKLSGYVWEDEKQGKESKLNGQKDENEKFIEGIQVTLHTKDNSKIMYTDSSTMQTKTNSNGYYEFEIPIGPEYYVEFTYNGQNYQHTVYNTWTGNGNPLTSNSTETEKDRDNLNAALETITPNMQVKGTTINNTINEKDATYIDEECYRISAYTGAYGNEKDIKYYSTTSEYINLGITKRETADLALRKDVYKATTTIKGYTQDYEYNKRNLTTDEDGNKYWDISQRASDVYYNEGYTRDLKKADYYYNDTDINKNLKLYVTYVINVRNQSGVIDAKVRGVAEYYDEDYTYVEGSAYLGNRKGEKISDVTVSEETSAPISGYKQRTITGLDKDTLKAGDDMYIYITFAVGTGTDIKLDDDAGKGNMAEILGYSTYYGDKATAPNDGNSLTYTEYKEGDIAGRVDVDSNPGNAKSVDESTFEDDTDRAPYIRVKLATEERTTNGYVWEDARTNEVGDAVVGNGIRDQGETLIDGIKVELWNKDTNSIAKIYNGTTWVDAITETANGGQYSFDGFVPGNYYIKFIYGEKADSKYNGQDYKSTTYAGTKVDTGFTYSNPDNDDRVVETDTLYSDARDIYGNETTQGTRAYVTSLYSGEMTNPRVTKLNDNITSAYMQAKTGNINIYIEKGGDNLPGLTGTENLAYKLENIDLGLQERAKAQLMLSKEVSNIKVTLSNGNVLFDNGSSATNLTWQNKKYHTNGYDGKLMTEPNRNNSMQSILLTMDEELMHGATIKITYKIKVENIGEVDYASNEFYYGGNKTASDTPITTKVEKIIDYAGAAGTDDSKASRNNLRFDSSENEGWTAYSLDSIYSYKNSKSNDEGLISRELLNKDEDNFSGTVSQYSTILVKEFNKDLTPKIVSGGESSVETSLVLSQVMTSEESTDQKAYNNMAEIVSFENGIGRRMEYSIVGNQNPDKTIAEVDSDMAQSVTVLPPFGQTYIYYVLGAVIAVIAVAGIILIKVKVVNPKK